MARHTDSKRSNAAKLRTLTLKAERAAKAARVGQVAR